jgi:ferritin-like metal-binding protein YciE
VLEQTLAEEKATDARLTQLAEERLNRKGALSLRMQK